MSLGSLFYNGEVVDGFVLGEVFGPVVELGSPPLGLQRNDLLKAEVLSPDRLVVGDGLGFLVLVDGLSVVNYSLPEQILARSVLYPQYSFDLDVYSRLLFAFSYGCINQSLVGLHSAPGQPPSLVSALQNGEKLPLLVPHDNKPKRYHAHPRTVAFHYYYQHSRVVQSLLMQPKEMQQILCQRHNQKAYYLCIEDKCTLPVLICNQCVEDDHAHISVPIKKIKILQQQRTEKHPQTDELTNKIKSFYEDFKESMLAAIDEDQKLFIKEVCTKEKPELSEEVQGALLKINNNDFKDLKSGTIKQVMATLESKNTHEPALHQTITSQLNTRKQFFQNIKSQLKYAVSLNNRWEFVTAEGKKVRKGDGYVLESNMNLMGNQVLNGQLHRWKIVLKRLDKLSCLGFGIGTLNSLDRTDVSKNSIVCCICCNGPWAGKGVEVSEGQYLRTLLSEQKNSIVLQVDRLNGLFVIYGPEGKIFGKKQLSELSSQTGIIPIAKNADNAGMQFSLQTLS